MSKTEAFANDGPARVGAVRRLARRVLAVLAECNYAQRRLFELRTSADAYVMNSNVAPDTYEEFLHRTSGLLRHEPPAIARSRRAHR
jgi:hypothetical protein